ncbi:hypothetical protein PHOSAC3_150082 [Mesotoga infera]|nr:hypothetical protein PHOSAC3_150082 [Mesotoga infera]
MLRFAFSKFTVMFTKIYSGENTATVKNKMLIAKSFVALRFLSSENAAFGRMYLSLSAPELRAS